MVADKEWFIQYEKKANFMRKWLTAYAIFVKFFRKWRTINKIVYENGVQNVHQQSLFLFGARGVGKTTLLNNLPKMH